LLPCSVAWYFLFREEEVAMDRANCVTKIIIEERRPLGAGHTPRYWGKMHEPDLILVVYDTAAIDRINLKYQRPEEEQFRLTAPAKYALNFETGFTDSDIFAQVMVSHDEYRNAAVWFDNFYDLPHALEALRARHPEFDLPEQVCGVIDWPTKGDTHTPGASILTASVSNAESDD
jgi:hypothetical protein